MTDIMPFDGSFSYKKDKERIVSLGEQFKIKMLRLDEDIARLFFLDNNELELAAIPDGFALRHAATGADAARLGNSFLVTWTASYVLLQNDVDVMQLDNQRQQAIRTTAG
jgi:hypothetical protein